MRGIRVRLKQRRRVCPQNDASSQKLGFLQEDAEEDGVYSFGY